MSAVLAADAVPAAKPRAPSSIAAVLLGTGVVGGAFLKLLNTPAASSIRLVGAANSRRQQTQAEQLADRALREKLKSHGDMRDDAALLSALDVNDASVKVIIDATACGT